MRSSGNISRYIIYRECTNFLNFSPKKVLRCTIPEGPETRRLALQLHSAVANKTIENVEVISGRYLRHPESFRGLDSIPETERTVERVSNKGKILYWLLGTDSYIYCTLGMSARWTTDPALEHNRVKITFTDGTFVYFNDIRNFGSLSLHSGRKLLEQKLSELGQDPLTAEYDIEKFKTKLASFGATPICEALLDQTLVAGVGNYVRAEALYRSRINPWRQCDTLTDKQQELLFQAIRDVMEQSFMCGGNTIATYRDMYGNAGSFASQLLVYKQKVDPYNNRVKKEMDATKRQIWWVPAMQV